MVNILSVSIVTAGYSRFFFHAHKELRMPVCFPGRGIFFFCYLSAESLQNCHLRAEFCLLYLLLETAVVPGQGAPKQ